MANTLSSVKPCLELLQSQTFCCSHDNCDNSSELFILSSLTFRSGFQW